MNLRKLFNACVLALPLLLFTSPVIVSALASSGKGSSNFIATNNRILAANPKRIRKFKRVCPKAAPGEMRCHSQIITQDDGVTPLVSNTPDGYSPTQLRTAYQLPVQAAKPTTIALVDAFDSPTIENDLNVYSQTFNLPACTTANGCFKKVNQDGQQGSYPRTNAGWASEIALDVEIAHAICTNCKILLVEANSARNRDLYAAVDTAVKLGATVISNSYAGAEYATETSEDVHFNHPGVAITASTGDDGFGVGYPAASPYVTAVGGTSLVLNSNNTRQSETVWNGAGSGCSAYEPKPRWQRDTGCAKRTVADVAAVADPNTGAAIYNTTGYPKGWSKVGGTSLSAPLIAGIYALAGNSSSVRYGAYPYLHYYFLFDITSGSNSTTCSSYLCSGTSGYDGPTGLGAPRGIRSF